MGASFLSNFLNTKDVEVGATKPDQFSVSGRQYDYETRASSCRFPSFS
jgi:hypothetical protein